MFNTFSGKVILHQNILKPLFFFFFSVWTRDLYPYDISCHFLPGHGVLTALSARYQRSSCCCTDTSFPLLPKAIRELCWALQGKIKGKPPTWHFIINCRHPRAATELLDKAGLGCLEKPREGGQRQISVGISWAGPLGVLRGKGGLGKKYRLWILVSLLAKIIPEPNFPCLWTC